jgi:hypothetical protein
VVPRSREFELAGVLCGRGSDLAVMGAAIAQVETCNDAVLSPATTRWISCSNSPKATETSGAESPAVSAKLALMLWTMPITFARFSFVLKGPNLHLRCKR